MIIVNAPTSLLMLTKR